MLATLQIELDSKDDPKIKYSYGSLFQGLMMECIDTNYAEYLHNQTLNPYSQYVYFDKEKEHYIWQISTLTEDAKNNIIDKLVENIGSSITLTHNDLSFDVLSKNIINIQSYNELVDKVFLNEEKKNIIRLKLLTPTTYKSNNEYQIFPSIRALYSSIYNKWNTFSDKISLADEEVFEHIITHSSIIKYDLKSYKYNLEKVALNSFIGNLSILIKGPKELQTICTLLVEYAQYCGVGAKTSMGMGGIKFE